MPAQNLPGLALDYAHPLARGLAGWWPMNEGGGERVNDISPFGNHGKITGVSPSSTSGWAGGIHGRALALDGSDDYIRVEHSQSLAITGAVTLHAWVYVTSVATYGFIVGKFGTPTAYAGPYTMRWNATTGVMDTYRGTGSGENALANTSPTSIPLNAWTHVVFTDDLTTARLWWNGQQVGSASSVGVSIADAGQPLWIGRRTDGYYVPGRIAHVRIYNRALDAREVAQLYADPLAGALAPARASRYYSVAVVAPPPTPPTLPMSADRLNNRTFARTWRRGETG